MKTRIVLVCIAIMAICGSARANDELKRLLGERQVEYAGFCRVNVQGHLVFGDAQSIGVQECIVGSLPTDGHVKYVLLWNGEKLDRLVKFTKRVGTSPEMQEVIWRNPDTLL